MSSKRYFQKLDELNMADELNGTQHVGVCYDVVAIEANTKNGRITIGVPAHVAQELAIDNTKRFVALIVVDREAFNKL